MAFLVDTATADLLHGAQIDHSPDGRQWVSTVSYPERNYELTPPPVSARRSAILPQAYGIVWGEVDGMLVPSAWRCVFRAISARYVEDFGRNGSLEGV